MTMHDDEVAIDDHLVRRLIDSQLPQFAGQPLVRVTSSGTDNALFRLGDELVVRLPRIDWAVEDVDKEQTWLPRLAPVLPVAIPEPVALGQPAFGYPWRWSVYRWIDGTNPVVGSITGPARLAADLGGFIAALERADPTGGPPASRGVPLLQRDADTRAAITELGDAIDTAAVTAAWEAALDAPEWTSAPVWIHADLAPGNLLVVGGRLHAVIDFGALGVGDPACDLIVAWNLLPPPSRAVLRTTLDVDDATWARGRGWALTIALIALPYYAVRSATLARAARHVIAEVLRDE